MKFAEYTPEMKQKVREATDAYEKEFEEAKKTRDDARLLKAHIKLKAVQNEVYEEAKRNAEAH